jgi:hypothetical protein
MSVEDDHSRAAQSAVDRREEIAVDHHVRMESEGAGATAGMKLSLGQRALNRETLIVAAISPGQIRRPF